jgi:hypothetical protein
MIATIFPFEWLAKGLDYLEEEKSSVCGILKERPKALDMSKTSINKIISTYHVGYRIPGSEYPLNPAFPSGIEF